MDIREAIRVAGALADGTNPETDSRLEASSICCVPRVQAALKRAIVALESELKREEARKNRPVKQGRYWSRKEDEQVCEEVRQGMDFHQIARKHDRSVPSIVARLVKLGKIGTPTSSQRHSPKVA